MLSPRFQTTLLLLFSLNHLGAHAQDPAAIDPLKSARNNSLGTRFVAVPGTTVLFAVWETRLSEWNTFLREKKYQWTFQPHFKQDENHPVAGVNLQDAIAYCNWLTTREREENLLNNAQSYRLPTPDEWDSAVGLSAARKNIGTTTEDRMQDALSFPWGLTWPPPAKAANYAENEIDGYTDGYTFTSPVGQFTPTPEGIFDLAGNVWEWTDKPEVKTIPTGTLRGGSWAYFRRECLVSSYRYVVPADMRMPTVGFRCVFDDKQRTARLLADKDKANAQSVEQRLQDMRKSNDSTDKEALAKLREKLAGMDPSATSALPDPASLKPAHAGEACQNTLGMRFVPLEKDSKILICTSETRVRDFEAWLKTSGGTWAKKPNFLLGDTHPAAGVSWTQAKAFCQWLTESERKTNLLLPNASYRLPADLEWSAAVGLTGETGADPAARHLGNKNHFPWTTTGTEWKPPLMSVNLDATQIKGYSDGYSYTSAVDKNTPNALGLYEIGGNVAEWCEDPWPAEAGHRVIRGGSWLLFDREKLLSSARDHGAESSTRSDLGFRCVLDLNSK